MWEQDHGIHAIDHFRMRLFISMVFLPGLVLCLFKRNAFVKVQETGKTKLKMDGSPFK